MLASCIPWSFCLLIPLSRSSCPANVISERKGKRCTSARGKNKDDPKTRVFHAEHLAVNTSFMHQADLMQHMGYSSLEDLNLPRNYPSGSFTEDAVTVLTWENPAGEHSLTSNVSTILQGTSLQWHTKCMDQAHTSFSGM